MARPLDDLLVLPAPERERLIADSEYLQRALIDGPQRHPALYMQDYQQIPDWEDDWQIILMHMCRGSGKTLLMSWLVDKAVHEWGVRRMLFVGANRDDMVDTNINGDDGILACSRTGAVFSAQQHGKPQIRWPNGAICRMGYPGSPTTIRGGSNELVLCDEFAFWENVGTGATDDPLTMIEPTLRKGKERLIIATTPNHESPLVNRELLRISGLKGTVTKTCNLDQVSHLSEDSKRRKKESVGFDWESGVYTSYRGRQEYGGEIIIDPGTVVWTEELLAKVRLKEGEVPWPKEFAEILISVDPSRKTRQANDPTGIAVLGLYRDPRDPLEFAEHIRQGKPVTEWVVLLEAWDGRWQPKELAEELIPIVHRYREAGWVHGLVEDNVTGENFEPAMQKFGLEIEWTPVTSDAATGDKRVRAIDAVALYQMPDRVKHAPGLWRAEVQQKLFTGVPKTQRGHDDIVDAISQGVNHLGKDSARVMSLEEFLHEYGNAPRESAAPGAVREGMGVGEIQIAGQMLNIG